MGEHVGIFSPCLGKAKVAQLEHWGVTIVQQGVVQLEIPVYICMLRNVMDVISSDLYQVRADAVNSVRSTTMKESLDDRWMSG